ncbi:deubiquitinase OTUD6B [Toxorhynchites rutilus septentrionalis]|uniref:deubiquitinase OTUD6B n=1 Tax=Toxorhynchites rutilus septentrionalis TaxID=329112 RepID=UPI002479DD0C|nr:deubiquitinase OTUD6B [Toxorhynchites rutilus septentrionalis]
MSGDATENFPADEREEESISDRHRKEKKELLAKIQAMKKAKVDKKKRKEMQDEIVRLEAELEARHAEELKADELPNESPSVALNTEQNTADDDETGKQFKVSKAQRRREKKLQEQKEREAQIKAEESCNKNSPRIAEDKKIAEILAARGLASFNVPADGDCLYNAIKHQLGRLSIFQYDTADLRQLAADYIEDNKDTLIFYMSNPETGDILGEDEFNKYCFQVRNTKAWGGEIEIKALSSRLKCPIEIIQASGTSPIHGAGEDMGRKLVLTYHRHMYRLGEHYNSTVAAQANTGGDSGDDEADKDD